MASNPGPRPLSWQGREVKRLVAVSRAGGWFGEPVGPWAGFAYHALFAPAEHLLPEGVEPCGGRPISKTVFYAASAALNVDLLSNS